MDHYITQIKIKELRHLSDICISLKPNKRTNLLLTGKNGSGKTTAINSLKKYLNAIEKGKLQSLESTWPKYLNESIHKMQRSKNEDERYKALQEYERCNIFIRQFNDGINVEFNDKDGLEGLFKQGKFILAYYPANRMSKFVKQAGAEDVVLDSNYSLDSNPGNVLLKYLVHLKTQQAYARNENDMATVDMLDKWFERFIEALKILLDNPSVQLKYDYKNYNFEIIENGRNPYGFDQLSDGYSAALQIVADLIIRMEQNWLKKGELSSYDVEGIVLIDEVETHLHIALQKTILPFLTNFFPRIQFIVTTHSPYVLNSIENCVIYDLEKRIRMEDMSLYSAEGIVEGYFEQELYSATLMEKVKRYQQLVEISNPTDQERAERATLFTQFKQLSGDLSREAKSAFEEIEDRRKQNGKIYS